MLLMPRNEDVERFQTTVFEMNLNGLISDRELGILEALTENMTSDKNALELTTILTMADIEDGDIVDCIIARKFETALIIIS